MNVASTASTNVSIILLQQQALSPFPLGMVADTTTIVMAITLFLVASTVAVYFYVTQPIE